jgi:hypothetical protein
MVLGKCYIYEEQTEPQQEKITEENYHVNNLLCLYTKVINILLFSKYSICFNQ